jgi:hypothetical protein
MVSYLRSKSNIDVSSWLFSRGIIERDQLLTQLNAWINTRFWAVYSVLYHKTCECEVILAHSGLVCLLHTDVIPWPVCFVQIKRRVQWSGKSSPKLLVFAYACLLQNRTIVSSARGSRGNVGKETEDIYCLLTPGGARAFP